MGQALYRKYRSKSLDEVVGQEHITKTLSQALKQGRINHAYLFTGPRGVGKTSVARIWAHAINDLPYNDDSAHIDIIEIDAASNRRIDEIRELRDKVHITPTSAKYKVYIIDEVHMLTREAFNALLKTLEEPPAHAVFILATTDAHKLPETIISRTQRFSFRPADQDQTVALLESIAKKERIKIDKAALELLAYHGRGSFRDSVGLLDQVGSHDQAVESETVRQLLGLPPTEAIVNLLAVLSTGQTVAAVIKQLIALYDQGYQAAIIAKQLGQLVRERLIESNLQLETTAAMQLLEKLINVAASPDPERYLEIVLLSAFQPATDPVPQLESPTTKLATDVVVEAAVPAPESPMPMAATKKPTRHSSGPKVKGEKVLGDDTWSIVLQLLKQRHNTLYGVLRMAQPTFSADSLQLAFAFSFHQKRLLENSNRQKLADIILEITGQSVNIDCVVDKRITPFKAEPSTEVEQPLPEAVAGNLAAISNIFGSTELLES
jgi:DNA polymerase III subunit gamma/tau